jgi:hypothetical protein
MSKSQGGHHPVSYFAMKQHVSPETMHQQEREKHLAHEKKVQQEFEAMRKRGHERHEKNVEILKKSTHV